MAVFLHKNDLPSDFKWGKEVAIDVESTGLHLGRDRVCVIQLSMGDGNAHLVHVDNGDKSGAPVIAKILSDSNCLKIFHFGRYDIAMLLKYTSILAMPVYCTKIASKICRTYTDHHGLKTICRELLGIEISKQQQCSYWGGEKLTQEQISYASADVLYLHRLKAIMDGMMQREKRTDIFRNSCDFLPYRALLDVRGWTEDIFAH